MRLRVFAYYMYMKKTTLEHVKSVRVNEPCHKLLIGQLMASKVN